MLYFVVLKEIMILTDEEALERLSSKDNIINLVDHPQNIDPRANGAVQIIRPGEGLPKDDRGKRGAQIPDMIRTLIAQTAGLSDETCSEVGNIFGVTPATVSNSTRGLVHNRLDKELQEIGTKSTQEKAEKAHNLALDSLVASLGLVQELLPEADSLKEATKTALDLSRMVANLKPREEDETRAKTLVVISMPSLRKETHFETIDV